MFSGHGLTLWDRHYHPGVTGSFHGDMAAAFDAMSKDPELDPATVDKIRRSSAIQMDIERRPDYTGRKWFCERFGTMAEKNVLASRD